VDESLVRRFFGTGGGRCSKHAHEYDRADMLYMGFARAFVGDQIVRVERGKPHLHPDVVKELHTDVLGRRFIQISLPTIDVRQG